MKNLRALAAAAVAVVTFGGAAQAAPPPMVQSPSDPAALQAVPQAPAPDSAALALAQRYLTMIHYQAILQKGLDQLVPVMMRAVTQTNQGMTQAQKLALAAALTQAAQETFADFMPRFQERAAEVIATRYTTEELTALVDFYDSPVGRRIADKSLDMQQLMSDSLQGLRPELARAMIVRFCKKTACPPALKAITPNAS